MNLEKKELDFKTKFIRDVTESRITIFKRKRDAIQKDLEKMGYPKMENSYEYLLGIKLWLLTEESIAEFTKKQKQLDDSIKILESKTIERLYDEDIESFLALT